MAITPISTLPTAPARTDAPAVFVTNADAFLGAIVVMQGQLNTSIGEMNIDIAGVNTNVLLAEDWATENDAAVSGTDWSAFANATGAAPTGSAKAWATTAAGVVVADGEYSAKSYASDSATSATESADSATAAGLTAGASLWVSGQSYDAGDAAVSGIDFQTYRAETTTSGTTDPSADANWTKLGYSLPSQTGNAGKYLSTDGTDESWAAVEALPSQTGNSGKYLSTDGTDPSWETLSVVGGGGTTTALPATLTSASVAAHTLTSTSFGKALTLPDATTLSKGVTAFAFKNDSFYDVPIKNDAGQIINWLYGGDYTVCTLTDNSTANGEWDFSNKQVIGLLGSGEFILPTATGVYDYNQCKLSDDKWVVVVSQSGDYLAVVYDKSTQTFGSLTLVNTTAATSGIAVQRVSDTQFIIAACSTTNVYLFTATVSGTTITPENSVLVTLPSAMSNAKTFRFVPYNGSFIFASYSSSEIYFFAASVSVTTPSAGSVESHSTTGAGVPPIIPDSQTSDRFLTYFYNSSGTTTNFLTYTVSGTTLTAVAGPVSTASTGALTYIFPQLDDGRFIVRLRSSTQAKYVVATLTGGSITLSTASITPKAIESYIFGWKLIGNDVICVTTDSNNYVSIESARNTSGVATAATESVNSNYGGWLAGQSDDGLYILNQDFQEYDTQVYKITVDGSGNPQREFVDYYKGTQSFTPKIAWFGQFEQSGVHIAPYSFGDNARNNTISPVNYRAMASNRYHQIGDDIEFQNAAYWDAEKSTIIQFSGKRAGYRSYLNVTQNHFDGDFSEGWDSYAYQLLDSPNTYALWINLRKVCDA